MSTCLWCHEVELEGHDLCKQCRELIAAISQGIDENRHVSRAFLEFIDVLADKGYVVRKNKKHEYINERFEEQEPREFINDPLLGRKAWKPPYDPNNPFRL